MIVKGLDHIGIAVWDIETALPFLVDVFGGSVIDGPVAILERDVVVQFVEIGGTRLELLAPVGEGQALNKFLARRGSGLHHVCIEVDDIHECASELKARGIPLGDEEPWMSPHGWALFIHPQAWSGVAIELRECVSS